MYAVIKTGGKQYKVAKGDVLHVEKIEVAPGETIQFDEVLMVGGEKPVIGSPLVKNGRVSATVVSHGREKKIKIIKFRRRKHYDKQMGHRQYFTAVKITDIHSA